MTDISLDNSLPPLYPTLDPRQRYTTPVDSHPQPAFTSPSSSAPRSDVTLPSFSETFGQFIIPSSSEKPASSLSSSTGSQTPPSPESPSFSPLTLSPSPPASSMAMDIDPTDSVSSYSYSSPSSSQQWYCSQQQQQQQQQPPSPPTTPRSRATVPMTVAQYMETRQVHTYDALEYVLTTDADYRRELLDTMSTRASIWRQPMWHTIYDLAPTVLDRVVARLEAYYPSPVIPVVKPDQDFHQALKLVIKNLIIAS
ncbi:hypothetical protein H4R33_005683 [Dimargaris cristalligena]|nr:hypothetical protein H4R33_005683 [Dimargaris cristalligena]